MLIWLKFDIEIDISLSTYKSWIIKTYKYSILLSELRDS